MKWADFWFGAFMAGVMAFGVASITFYTLGETTGRRSVERTAVIWEAGRYAFDPKTGETRFMFNGERSK